jgi:hypothetical protein
MLAEVPLIWEEGECTRPVGLRVHVMMGARRCGSTRYYDKGWYKVCAGVGRVCKLVTKTGGCVEKIEKPRNVSGWLVDLRSRGTKAVS